MKGTEVGLKEGKQTVVMLAINWHITSFLKKFSGIHFLNNQQMLSAWLMPGTMVSTGNKTLNVVPALKEISCLSPQLDFNRQL